MELGFITNFSTCFFISTLFDTIPSVGCMQIGALEMSFFFKTSFLWRTTSPSANLRGDRLNAWAFLHFSPPFVGVVPVLYGAWSAPNEPGCPTLKRNERTKWTGKIVTGLPVLGKCENDARKSEMVKQTIMLHLREMDFSSRDQRSNWLKLLGRGDKRLNWWKLWQKWHSFVIWKLLILIELNTVYDTTR